jgi:hypothetical protein
VDNYERLLAEVDEVAQNNLRTWLEALPAAAGRPLIEYCFRGQTQVLTKGLARKVALSTAYDLGCSDAESLTKINVACLSGGIFVLLWDEIVDTQANVRPARDYLLCHLLFNKYLSDLIAIRGPDSASGAITDLTALETMTYSLLYKEELLHAGFLEFHDTNTIRERCSSLKPVAHEFLCLTGHSALEPDLFGIIEQVSFAMCTMDDLADWEEDLRNGRYTYPLQLAGTRSGIPIHKIQDNIPTIFRTLACSTLYHELMKQITEAMESALHLANPLSPRLAHWIAEMLTACNGSWRDHVEYLQRLAQWNQS